MKQLNQLNVEEFRVIHNFTINQMIDILKIPEANYEGSKDEPVVCYSYRPEIKEIFIANAKKEIKEVCERYRIEFAAEKADILSEVMQMNKEQLEVCSKVSKVGDRKGIRNIKLFIRHYTI
ncbi:hypothetical protein [Bacillus thuringiensis]|uniref:Uncharacterized protein n=1 Tax=Bacillus thuringiensis TaxID=1428 RepID=A0A9X6TQT1_BACTU|nr:hypothetical protein [Bacillus thuringiensis]PEA90746.1 hypothetical protein CON71_05315 [Bacillus thuringiensis]